MELATSAGASVPARPRELRHVPGGADGTRRSTGLCSSVRGSSRRWGAAALLRSGDRSGDKRRFLATAVNKFARQTSTRPL